jgi:release factor glutamine methyltransferase
MSADPGGVGDQTTTWRTLLSETRERLTSGGCPDAETSARRIVEEASGFEGAQFAIGLSASATVRGVANLDRMVADRLTGTPLQYVLRRWSFRTLDLFIDPRVLIPRPETEVVAGVALDELRRFDQGANPIAADLGTGSGAIGLSLAVEHPTVNVWLTDRSDGALEVARANLAGIGRPGSRVTIGQGSWFEALEPELEGQLAVVVSNPPYVAETDDLPAIVASYEPRGALVAGPMGTEDLEVLVAEAPRWLVTTGSLVLEMAPAQTDGVARLARTHFLEVEVFADYTGRNRGVVARGLR